MSGLVSCHSKRGREGGRGGGGGPGGGEGIWEAGKKRRGYGGTMATTGFEQEFERNISHTTDQICDCDDMK